MAKQYVITDEEMMSLIEQLELAKLRQEAEHAPQSVIHKHEIDDIHRTFHFYVVRWAQSVGFNGYRR